MSTQQASPDPAGNYRLRVENFGPIVEASVDLRPLTVFIGPSNTGKSYLAILIYALHQCFGEGNIFPPRYRRPFSVGFMSRRLFDTDAVNAPVLDILRKWLPENLEKKLPDSLPPEVTEFIGTSLEHSEDLDRFLRNEISRCFGVDHPSDLIRYSNRISRSTVELTIPQEEFTESVGYKLQIDKETVRSSSNISDTLLDEIAIPGHLQDRLSDLRLRTATIPDEGDSELRLLLSAIAGYTFESLLKPLYRTAYYLPADRTGVMHSHQVVVSTIVQNAAAAGLRPLGRTQILSGVLADFLSQLIEIDGRPYRPSEPTRELAKQLEDNVLKGAVRMDRAETDYPSFAYRPGGWKKDLPLIRASSMVSELAPVVLYLRYHVRPGDILIIEEPESHLHPAMQVALIRQLAGVVRAGVRVIVTTHSEWVLEELANLIRLSQIPEDRREGIADGDVALHPSEVGAWLFEPSQRPKGSKVSEVSLDDSGLYPSGFDDVATALHNDWAEITSRIGEDR